MKRIEGLSKGDIDHLVGRYKVKPAIIQKLAEGGIPALKLDDVLKIRESRLSLSDTASVVRLRGTVVAAWDANYPGATIKSIVAAWNYAGNLEKFKVIAEQTRENADKRLPEYPSGPQAQQIFTWALYDAIKARYPGKEQ